MEKHIENILVPVDFKEPSLVALSQSFVLAQHQNIGITLLYVYEEAGLWNQVFAEDESSIINDTVIRNLKKISAEAAEKSGVPVHYLVERGVVHTQIVEVAKKIKARFIVMSRSNFQDSQSNVLGSDTSRVLRAAPCPVITINKDEYDPKYRSIMLPLDLGKQTKHKVTKAIEIAQYFNSSVRVMMAVMDDNPKEMSDFTKRIEEVKKQFAAQNIKCFVDLVKPTAKERLRADVIMRYARKQGDVDLIILMTQQEKNWRDFFMGSTASEVLRNSEYPVLTILPKSEDK
ncbi:MAG: universal stress protein [Bacteroidota bacterium]